MPFWWLIEELFLPHFTLVPYLLKFQMTQINVELYTFSNFFNQGTNLSFDSTNLCKLSIHNPVCVRGDVHTILQCLSEICYKWVCGLNLKLLSLLQNDHNEEQ